MADNDIYLRLRRMTGETQDKENYTDADLDLLINEYGGDLNAAAARIWREKAATYADQTDISEAGSSRKDSVLYDRAIKEQAYYEQQASGAVSMPTGSTTRRIVRA